MKKLIAAALMTATHRHPRHAANRCGCAALEW